MGKIGMRKISEDAEVRSSDWGKMKASMGGAGAGGEVWKSEWATVLKPCMRGLGWVLWGRCQDEGDDSSGVSLVLKKSVVGTGGEEEKDAPERRRRGVDLARWDIVRVARG